MFMLLPQQVLPTRFLSRSLMFPSLLYQAAEAEERATVVVEEAEV
jgi:hypothetical protein